MSHNNSSVATTSVDQLISQTQTTSHYNINHSAA